MTRPRGPAPELGPVLEAVRARADLAARRDRDPVRFVHRFAAPLDRELAGLVASAMAFGRVTSILAKLDELFARIASVAPTPTAAADEPARLGRALEGFRHRLFVGDDVARLLVAARAVQRAEGSLGAAFARRLDAADGDLREALAALRDTLRAEGGFAAGGPRRGPAHLLPDVRGAGGSKRLLLFLRWMVRPADGIDLGLWPVPPAVLRLPVDVHIHKLARNLGLTRRRDLGWRTVEEITGALRALDAEDPAKYDFSLCHLGMLQGCPSRRDPARCEGCGVRPVCLHWRRAPEKARPATRPRGRT